MHTSFSKKSFLPLLASTMSLSLLSSMDFPSLFSSKPKRLPYVYTLFSSSSSKKEETESISPDAKTKTFIWGNGSYQAKPDGLMRFSNFEPKLIKDFKGPSNPNLKDVQFGEHMEAGITVNGNEVYVWNKQKLSASRDEEIDDYSRKGITKVDFNQKAKQVLFTSHFLWVLSEKGELFQYPIDAKWDEMEEEHLVSFVNKPRKVEGLSKLKQISAGIDHLAMLDQSGNIYMMGGTFKTINDTLSIER